MSSYQTIFVSEQVMEGLLSELVLYAMKSCLDITLQQATGSNSSSTSGSGGKSKRKSSILSGAPKIQAASTHTNAFDASTTWTTEQSTTSLHTTTTTLSTDPNTTASSSSLDMELHKTVAAEMAAAKLERLGYAIGYRLTERLAYTKTWNSLLSQDAVAQTSAQQLEAVKFLCKEVWVQLFGKQIDKLQTNHRGVFVLKDLNLKWLQGFPNNNTNNAEESSRVKAVQLLAFPCGIVRGCLADLGIPSVVSCDFLADGQSIAACSFNIKVK